MSTANTQVRKRMTPSQYATLLKRAELKVKGSTCTCDFQK